MTTNNDFIEQQIVGAVRFLLAGRVNEILQDSEFAIPIIEFGDYCGASVVTPVIALSGCERTEKERLIHLDAYSLTIVFSLPQAPESELCCYAYAGAVSRAVCENPTLGGAADRVFITGKKFTTPKNPHCGDGWEVTITLRIAVEQWR